LTLGRGQRMAALAALVDAGALGSPMGSMQAQTRRKDTGMMGTLLRDQELRDMRTHPALLPHALPALAIPCPEDGWARTSPRVPARTYHALPPCRHSGQPSP